VCVCVKFKEMNTDMKQKCKNKKGKWDIIIKKNQNKNCRSTWNKIKEREVVVFNCQTSRHTENNNSKYAHTETGLSSKNTNQDRLLCDLIKKNTNLFS